MRVSVFICVLVFLLLVAIETSAMCTDCMLGLFFMLFYRLLTFKIKVFQYIIPEALSACQDQDLRNFVGFDLGFKLRAKVISR